MTFDWRAFDVLLAEKAPEMLAGLRPPATMEGINAAQQAIGRTLPKDVVAAFLAHDGQDGNWRSFYAFFGMYRWHTVADVARAYRENVEWFKALLERAEDPEVLVQSEETLRSDQAVRMDHWNDAWIPLAWDPTGAMLFMDLAPGPAGTLGQIVAWDKTDGANPVPIARSLDALLTPLSKALMDGRVTCVRSPFLPGWTDPASGQALYTFPSE